MAWTLRACTPANSGHPGSVLESSYPRPPSWATPGSLLRPRHPYLTFWLLAEEGSLPDRPTQARRPEHTRASEALPCFETVPRTLPTAAVCEAAVQACVNWQRTVLPETRQGLSTVRTTRCALGTLTPKGTVHPARSPNRHPPSHTHVMCWYRLATTEPTRIAHTCEPRQACGVMHTPFPPFTLHSLAAIRWHEELGNGRGHVREPQQGPCPECPHF